MSSTNFLKRLVDSALIVAVLSGACYIVGYGGYVRDVRKFGLPAHLLPQPQVESLMLAGAADLWLLAAIVIALSAILAFCVTKSRRFVNALEWYRARFEQSKRLYTGLVVVIVTGLVFGYPYWAPLQESALADDFLLRVAHLQLKDAAFEYSGSVRYVTRNSGVVVLKETKSGNFIILNENDIRVLEIEPRK